MSTSKLLRNTGSISSKLHWPPSFNTSCRELSMRRAYPLGLHASTSYQYLACNFSSILLHEFISLAAGVSAYRHIVGFSRTIGRG